MSSAYRMTMFGRDAAEANELEIGDATRVHTGTENRRSKRRSLIRGIEQRIRSGEQRFYAPPGPYGVGGLTF